MDSAVKQPVMSPDPPLNIDCDMSVDELESLAIATSEKDKLTSVYNSPAAKSKNPGGLMQAWGTNTGFNPVASSHAKSSVAPIEVYELVKFDSQVDDDVTGNSVHEQTHPESSTAKYMTFGKHEASINTPHLGHRY